MANANKPEPRPGIVTFLSIMLAVLAMSGFGNAVVFNQSDVVAAAAQNGVAVGGSLYTSLALANGSAALALSVALWRMASWARPAFLVWSLSVVAFLLWIAYSVQFFHRVGLAQISIFVIGAIAVLTGIYLFLSQTLRWSAGSNKRWSGP